MSVEPTDSLERLLRQCGLDWMIDWYAPPEQALPALRAVLAEASREVRERWGAAAPVLSESSLLVQYERNRHKVAALLQALGSSRSSQMVAMAWSLLWGAHVASLHLEYEAERHFLLQVELTWEGNSQRFESSDIDDAAMLRHLGITKIDGRPLFDGFHPLRLSG